ncbi:hypothetical protein [Limnochorda pilosa]|uniref:Uncharacterized protein n=1 Tax=Limnochorda pilosa TaxID=1555112 RepID=A0A0K2SIE4_LIMPI|nr:hypothetical protein [Limnochorda pilosa]BAS26787.1 hypothetical protein LIP_0930 [Limnochorda pilosa]
METRLNWKRLAYLSLFDLRNATRDPLLEVLIYVPFVILALLRLGLPPLRAALLRHPGFDLALHYPFIISLVPLLMPIMVGMVVGFILLEERDENVLTAISVTSLSKASHLAYKTIVPMAYATVISYASIHLAGLGTYPIAATIPGVLVCSLVAPVVAFFVAAYAENKVTGLVLAKASGLLVIFPVVAHLLAGPWAWIMGVTPSFWLSIHFTTLAAGQEGAWLYLGVGTVYLVGLLVALIRRFERSVF